MPHLKLNICYTQFRNWKYINLFKDKTVNVCGYLTITNESKGGNENYFIISYLNQV